PRGLGARLLEERDDDRVELRVQALDPLDGGVDKAGRGGIPPADELGLGGGVEEGGVVRHGGDVRRAVSPAQAVVGGAARWYRAAASRTIIETPVWTRHLAAWKECHWLAGPHNSKSSRGAAMIPWESIQGFSDGHAPCPSSR